MSNKLSALFTFFAAISLNAADFDPRTFGATGDGAAKDTAAVQAAIDAAASKGGGRVVLADGTFLSGALMLKSGVELHIDRTATLLASPDIEDFPDWPDGHVVRENLPRQRLAAFIYADEAAGIAITGLGTIDCNGKYHIKEKESPDWKGWRYERVHPMPKTLPRVVFLAGCRDVAIRDVTMTGQPAGWSYWIHDCDRVQMTGLKILANVRYPNNDGIHVNCSRDVTISGCIIETGDDSIVVRANSRSLKENKPCERVVATGCTLRSWSSGIRIGWIDDGVIRDCIFSDLAIHDTSVGVSVNLPKRRNKPGWTDYGREATRVENLQFANIRMNGIYARPVLITMVPEEAGTHVAAVRDLYFSNVHATGLEFPLLEGRAGMDIENIVFSGCSFDKVPETSLPEDWRRHGYAVNDRRPQDQYVTRHAKGIRFNDTIFNDVGNLATENTGDLAAEDADGTDNLCGSPRP